MQSPQFLNNFERPNSRKFSAVRGLLAVALIALFPCSASSQTFTVLHSFQAGLDGNGPWGGVTLDQQGNLYGTTWSGGRFRYGVVFKINAAGDEKVLYSFAYRKGAAPFDTPFVDAAGNIYGTTQLGAGSGTVFELRRSGRLDVLHRFLHNTFDDGTNPWSGVIQDAAGNLYGTTPFGGAHGAGVVYKVDPSGVETILYSFAASYVDPPDGSEPYGGLVMDSAGNLYGTTIMGGDHNDGTVFKVDPSGNETVLHSFSGDDGAEPSAGLVQDAVGNLYGTTYTGTVTSGEVFKLDPQGVLTVLYGFGQTLTDGLHPYSGVVIDAAGNIFGTASEGGAFGAGTIYELDADGTYTTLHDFSSGVDGGFPYAGVTRDPSGDLYGTTVYGGVYGFGVVYKITP